MLHCYGNEIRQLVRALFQILDVEHTFGESAKESRHSIFENFAAWAEQCRIRIEFVSERNEIVLVSAVTVQMGNCPFRPTGHKFVNEIQPRLHFLVGTLISGRISSIWD